MLVAVLLLAIAAITLAARRWQIARRKRLLRAERQQRRAEQATAWERMMAGKPTERPDGIDPA